MSPAGRVNNVVHVLTYLEEPLLLLSLRFTSFPFLPSGCRHQWTKSTPAFASSIRQCAAIILLNRYWIPACAALKIEMGWRWFLDRRRRSQIEE